MNQHLHRLVYNRARGQLMAVQESAGSVNDGRVRGGTRGARGAGRAARASLRTVTWAALVVAGLAALNPAWPQALPLVASPGAPAGQRPVVDAAANGVPVVHIAPPSAAGVSRNGYKEFNVGSNGLILNNSAASVQTQLGGWIAGNPQLGYVPARLIVNEVTGTNRSVLLGSIEVAGRKADVVIANPNGLLCDGCGFINTGRAMLTTGVPDYDAQGGLAAIDVRQGSLDVGPAGLNATNLEQLDLLARGLVVEGEVWAGNLNVLAGANRVLYASLGDTPSATARSGSGSAPSFAIDIKDLGGMYARRIYLLATEQGLGVNSTGRLAALQGSLQLSANGDLTLRDSYGKEGIVLAGRGDITLTGATVAPTDGVAADVQIASAGTLRQQGLLDVGGRLDVTAAALDHGGTTVQRGNAAPMQWTISGSAGNSGTLYSAGDVALTAGHYVDRGTLLAEGRLTLSANGLQAIGGLLFANGPIALDAGTGDLAVTNGAAIRAGSTITAAAGGTLGNIGSTWQSAGDTTLHAATILNHGGSIASGGQLTVRAAGLLDNSDGQLGSVGGSSLAAAEMVNDGGLVAAAVTRLDTGVLANRRGGVISGMDLLDVQTHGQRLDNDGGTLVSGGTLAVQAGDLSNRAGQIAARGASDDALRMSVAAMDNTDGSIASVDGGVHLQAQGSINAGGSISAGTVARLQTLALDNGGGSIVSGGSMTLGTQGHALRNDAGTLSAGDASSIDAGAITNDSGGRIAATQALTLHGSGELSNRTGSIAGGTRVDLAAAALDNTGGTVSADELALRLGDGSLRNEHGTLSGRQALQIQAGAVRNAGGVLQTGGALSLGAPEVDIDNRGGIVQSQGLLTLQASRLDNAGGRLTGIGGVSATTTHGIDNTRGEIGAAGPQAELRIAAAGQAVNNTDGRIVAERGVSLLGAELSNAGGTIVAGDAASLDVMGLHNGDGTVRAATDLTLKAGAVVSNAGGRLQAGRDLALSAADLVQTAGGLIAAGRDATMRIEHGLTNNYAGIVDAQRHLDVASAKLDNDGALLASGGDASLSSGAISNRSGAVQSGGSLRIDGGSLDNGGGRLWSQAGQRIDTNGQALNNSGGGILAGEGLTLLAGSLVNAEGQVAAGGALSLASASLDNRRGSVGAGQAATLAVAGALRNDSGTIVAQADLDLQAGALDNGQGGLIASSSRSAVLDLGSLANGNGSVQAGTDLTLAVAGTVASESGQLAAGRDLLVSSMSLTQSAAAAMVAGRDARLNVAQALTSSGGSAIAAGRHLSGDSGSLSNDGAAISAGGDVRVDVTGAASNRGGSVRTAGALSLAAGALDNTGGTIQASGPAAFATGAVVNRGGLIASGADLSHAASGAIDNTQGGEIGAGAALTLNAAGQRLANDGGRIVAQGPATVTAAAMTNADAGLLGSGQDLRLNLTSLENGNGTVQAGTDLVAAVGGPMVNAGGQWLAGRDLAVSAAMLSQGAAAIAFAGRDATIALNGSLLNNEGASIVGRGEVAVTAAALNNDGGTLAAGGRAAFAIAGHVDNRAGVLQAGAAMALTSSGLDNAAGQVLAGGALSLDAGTGDLVNDGGAIRTADTLDLRAGALSNRFGTVGSVAGGQLHAASVDNHAGRLLSGAAQTIRTDSLINDAQGQIASNGPLAIVATTRLDNHAATIGSASTVDLETGTLDNAAGAISSGDALRISAETLDNRGGALSALREAGLDVLGNFTNDAGIVVADGLRIAAAQASNRGGGLVASTQDATLNVASLANGNGVVQAGADLAIVATGRLDNAGGQWLGGRDVRIAAAELSQSASALTAAGRDATVQTTGALANHEAAAIDAQGRLTIVARTLDNGGASLGANGALSIAAADAASNRGGVIAARGELTLSSASLDNALGQLRAGEALGVDVRDGTLGNDGGVIASAAALTARAGDTGNRAGTISGDSVALTTRSLDNQGGLVASQTNLDVDTRGAALSNVAGVLAADQAVRLKTADLDNAAGQISGGTQVDIAAAGDVRNDAGRITSGTALTLTAARLAGNDDGRITAGGALRMDVGEGALVNANGLIAGVQDLALRSGALDNGRGTIASIQGALLLDTHGQALSNDAGRIQAAQDVDIAAGGASNRGGLIGGRDLSVRTTGFDNGRGALVASANLNARTGRFDNDAGLLQAGGAMNLDTLGQALVNTNSGSAGGIVGGGSVGILAGAFDNRDGILSSGGTQTLAVAGDFDNTRGRIGASGDIRIASAWLKNDSGQISTLGALDVAVSGTLDNQRGQLLAGGTANLEAAQFDNGASGSVQAGKVVLRAGRIDNRGGSFIAAGLVDVDTAQLDNTGGQIQSQRNVAVRAGTLRNDGGRIVAETGLSVQTESTAPGGTLSGGETVDLAFAGDYTNTGDVLANQRLAIRAASIDNSGRLKSGDVLDIGATGDLRNSGEISARTTRLSAGATLANSGLIDGTVTSVAARTLANTGRIYGDQIELKADDFSNDAAATVAARQALTIGADRIANTGGALLYSLGDLGIAGRTADAQRVDNIGSTIEARGNVAIAATLLNNANAGITTSITVGTTRPGTLTIQPEGTTERLDPSTLGWYAGYKTGTGRYVRDSTIYPLSRFGASPRLLPAVKNCTSATDSFDTVCTLIHNYSPSDAVWAVFDVAAPDFSDLVAPSPVPDYGGCMESNGGDSGTFSRTTFGPCGPYWTARDAYDAEVVRRTTIAEAALDVAITAFNDDLDARSFEHWYEFEVTERTTRTPVVTTTRPAQILAGGSIVLSGSGAKTNDNSVIVAGGTVDVAGARIANTTFEATQQVSEQGRERFRYNAYHGGFDGDYSVEYTGWTPYADAAALKTVVLSTGTVLQHAGDPSRALDAPAAGSAAALRADGAQAASGANRNAGAEAGIAAQADPVRSASAQQAPDAVASHAAQAHNPGQTHAADSTAADPRVTTPAGPALVSTSTNATDTAGSQGAGSPPDALAGVSAKVAGAVTLQAAVLAAAAQSSATTPWAPGAATDARPTVTAPGGNAASAAIPPGSEQLARRVILSATTGFKAPGNTLFVLHGAPNARFLVETDPRFTNERSFLSSDYFLQQLRLDPERQLKRYGDGFAEQQALNDQVLALTGRRYLSGYADTQTEFAALMDAGAAFAKQYQLTPGVTLGAEQMALLTTDIVWLEAQDVALPDGSTQRVLVLKLYLRQLDDGDLQPNGGLISGSIVRLASAGELVNSAGIVGDVVGATARDIVNSGSVRGGRIGLAAENDLSVLGGQIQGTGADSAVRLSAGRDLVLNSTTQASGAQTATGTAIRTAADRIATIQGGNVTLDAARDLLAQGAQVQAGQQLLALAGGDIVIQPLQQEHRLDVATGGSVAGRTGYVSETTTTNQLSTFDAGGNLTLIAQGKVDANGTDLNAGGNVLLQGRDVNVQAALDRRVIDTQAVRNGAYDRVASDDQSLAGGSISAGNNLIVVATGDAAKGQGNITVAGATLTSGTTSGGTGALALQANNDVTVRSLDTRHTAATESYSKSSSLLGSETSSSASNSEQTRADASTLSGRTVSIVAGDKAKGLGNVTIAGSNVVADGDVSIAAGRDLTITTSAQTQRSSASASETTSGLFSSGVGFTIGTQSQAQAQTSRSVTQAGSTIGSLGGNVTLSAGGAYQQTGSQVLALNQDSTIGAGNVDISAGKVRIDAATQTSQGTEEQHFKQSGLTVSVSSPVIGALQTAAQMGSAAGKTSDSRMQALAAASAALSVSDAAAAIAQNPAALGGIGINVSIGASRNDSQAETASTTALGSKVTAAGNVTIKATGQGADSTLDVIGSDIQSGGKVGLKADGAVNLEAAKNTAEQHGTNSGSSASIGVGFSFGGSQNGVTVNASASTSRGNSNGSGTSYTNTHVSGQQVDIQSGGDTNLKGAVVSANKVTGQIGGNLNIESLQDTSKYDARQESAGVGVSLCIPPICYGASSASVSVSNAKANGDYASVTEQSGIKAGDGGFQIGVKGNTDLKGGAITSTQAAIDQGRNSLTTGTLTTSDLQNLDSYDASGVSLGVSASGKLGDQSTATTSADATAAKNAKTGIGTSPGISSDKGSQGSTTKSGISAGAITITDGEAQKALTGQDASQTLASLNTEVTTDKDTAGALAKQWNGPQLMEQTQANLTITSTALPRIATEIGSRMNQQAADLRTRANTLPDSDPDKQSLLSEAAKYDEGGAYRIAAHAALGALSGGLGGALGAGASAAAAPALNELQNSLQSTLAGSGMSDGAAKSVSQLLAGGVAAGIGAVTGGSAGAATAGNADFNNRQLHQSEAQKLAQLKSGKSQQQQYQLDAAACYLVHCADGVPQSDANYAGLKALQDAGANYISEQNQLKGPGEFAYSRIGLDGATDYYTSHPAIKGVTNIAGGAAGTAGGVALTTAAAAACPETGVSCVGIPLGAALTKGGLDQFQTGIAQVSGTAPSTEGQTVLNSFNPSTPERSNPLVKDAATAAGQVAVGVVGGKVLEAAASNGTTTASVDATYNQLARASYSDFVPQGIKATPDVMATPQAQALVKEIQAGSPGLTQARATEFAANYIESGATFLQMGIAAPGSVLLKAVPKGDGVSAVSGYWMSPQQAQAIATMTPEQAGQVLGLPASQAARIQQTGMDFFAISPKTGTTPIVFTSEVAPTSQGSATMPAGAQQVIVPNRQLWTDPVPIDPFTLHPSNPPKGDR